MPAVVAASETEAAVAVSLIEGVGVGVASEVEVVSGAVATSFRRTLSEVITDGDDFHDTDHEALAQFHNKFDLRAVPEVGDAVVWDGSAWKEASVESPYAGTWLDALFVRPDTVHVNDDEFVGTTIDPAWTETSYGTTVWTQGLGRMSVAFSLQGSAPEMSTILRAVPSSYPFTIETAMSTHPMNGYFHGGLCLTSGTGGSATIVSGIMHHDSYDNPHLYFMGGTLADGNSGGYQSLSPNEQPHPKAFEYLRLVWTATNTFKYLVSHDGVSWANYFSDNTTSLTPTHFGMTVSAYNLSTQMASFEYVRVTEADLS